MDAALLDASNVLQNLQAGFNPSQQPDHRQRSQLTNDTPVTVSAPDHAPSMLAMFHRMYQQHIGCDFIIAVESAVDGSTSEFLVHKLILNGASKFFKGIFDYHHGNRQVITGMRLSDINNIIDFMYTGNLKLDRASVWGLWTAASYLQIPTAMRLCEEFSKRNHVNQSTNQSRSGKEPSAMNLEMKANPQAVFNVPVVSRKSGAGDSIRLGRIITVEPEPEPQYDQLQMQANSANMASRKEHSLSGPVFPIPSEDSSKDKFPHVVSKGLDLLATSASSLQMNPSQELQQVSAANLQKPVTDVSQLDLPPVKVEEGYLSSGSAMDMSDGDVSDGDDESFDNEWMSKTENTKPVITKRLKITLSKCNNAFRLQKNSKQTPELGKTSKLQSPQVKKHACQLCRRSFQYYSFLKLHIRQRHKTLQTRHSSNRLYRALAGAIRRSDEGVISCAQCDQPFKYYTLWKCHFLKEHSSFLTCNLCRERFVSSTQLRFHQMKFHKVKNVKTYSCNSCSRIFLHEQTLNKHNKSTHRARQRKCKAPLKVKKAAPCKRKSSQSKERMNCDRCTKSYSSVYRMKAHLKSKHRMNVRDIQLVMDKSGYNPSLCTPQSYKCFKCDQMVNSIFKLKAHLYKVHKIPKGMATKMLQENGVIPNESKMDIESLSCLDCNRTFKRKKHLQEHAKLQHGLKLSGNAGGRKGKANRNVTCEVEDCGFMATQVKQMKTHMREQHPLRLQLHHCQQCSFKCSSLMELDRHLKKGHDKMRQAVCDLCGKCFKKQYYLRIHKFNAHKIYDDTMKIFKCDYINCKYQSTSKHALTMHAARHNKEKPFTCDYCGRKVKTKKNLEKHINKVHMNIRPFMCHLCGMSYGEDSELKNHITRQHIGAKPYQCEHCPYKSVDKHALRGHLFAVHRVKVSEDQEIFKCDYCEYMCDRKARLQKHMKAHLGIKDEVCSHCGKAFSHHHSLVNHIKWIHTAKSLRCDYCDYLTVDHWKLSQHIRVMHTHRGLKPYKCPYCDFHSATGGNCRKHVMNKHKGMKVGWIKVTEVPNPENPSQALPEPGTFSSQ